METRQQLTPVEGERFSRSPLGYCRLERPDIAAELVGGERQLVVAT